MPTIFNQNNVKKQGKIYFWNEQRFDEIIKFSLVNAEKLVYIISWAFLAQLIQVYL